MFGIIMTILLGIMFIAFGGWGVYSRRKFFKHAIMLPGTVTGFKTEQSFEHDKRRGHREVTMYYTVATFEFEGQKREVVSKWASSAKPQLGTPCQIGVHPQNIADARIYSKTEGVICWCILAGGIVAMLLVLGTLTGKF